MSTLDESKVLLPFCFWCFKAMTERDVSKISSCYPYWRLMLPWVMGVGFENTCKFQDSEMSPGLFQDFMDEYANFF